MREDHHEAVRRVDERRLWQRHMEMAQIGAIPGNGVNRAAFSAEDIEARHLLLSWASARNFAVSTDAIGNLFVRRPGLDPAAAPVLAGSHMDSQPRGGRFDGIYGVLAALEALEAIDEAGVKTQRPIELVAWSNEEGGRFGPCTMGSAVHTGARALSDFLQVTDNDGVMLKDALAETLAALPQAEKRAFKAPVAAYIEAHIEQGPLLEMQGKSIGVVTGIQGLRWFNVEVFGESAHAGHDAARRAQGCAARGSPGDSRTRRAGGGSARRGALYRRAHAGHPEFHQLGGEPRAFFRRSASSRSHDGAPPG